MPCDKYSGSMTDAALGELRPELEPELLAHAMECDACREALGHARAVQEFVDRSVESLVAGEPSPRFATNLRRRIAQESESRRSPWMAWAPVIASALALALVLAIMVARRPAHNGTNSYVASSRNPASTPSESAPALPAGPHSAERTTNKFDSPRTPRAHSTQPALSEIIVPQGQLDVAMQLSAAIDAGELDGNQLLAAQQESQKPLAVAPIEISPLEIPALNDVSEKPAGSIQY